MADTAQKLMMGFNLTRILGSALAFIYESGVVSRQELQDKLSGLSAKGAVTTKNVDIVIHRLRKKLEPYGITVLMVRTVGIHLSLESIAIISEALIEYDHLYGGSNALDNRTVANGQGIRENFA